MRYFDARIIENRALGNGYFVLRMGGCDSLAQSRPGQFIMLRGDWGRDPLLPRPVSLLSVAPEGRADLLAKSVGRETRLLEEALPGTRVSVLGPLGNGFPDPTPDSVDLLVAGGVGMPPLFMQAEHAALLEELIQGFLQSEERRDGGSERRLRDLGQVAAVALQIQVVHPRRDVRDARPHLGCHTDEGHTGHRVQTLVRGRQAYVDVVADHIEIFGPER